MPRLLKVGLGAAVAVALLLGGGWLVLAARTADTPGTARLRPAPDRAPATGTADGEWVVAADAGGFVGYRIRERLTVVTAPSDVVGRSAAVTGTVTIARGTVTAAEVTADLSELHTDQPPRDGAMHDRGLELNRFPTARFKLGGQVPLGTVGGGQVVHVQLPGDLTLHGVTRRVTVPLEARWDGPTIQVAGSFEIRRADFGLQVPSLLGFRIADRGVVELELTLTRKGAQPPVAGSTLQHHPTVPAPGGDPFGPQSPPCRGGRPLPGGGGRLLFAAGGDTTQLWVVGADGSGLRRIGGDDASQAEPAWSPDSTHIAYTRSLPGDDQQPPTVNVIRADGKGRRDLAPGRPAGEPAWSPDGHRLVVVTAGDSGDLSDLAVLNADGSGFRQLTTTAGADSGPSWSPDGRRLALATYADAGASNEDVAVVDADGSGLHRLTTAPGYEYAPAWSPDGGRIAYVKDGAIHVMNADGTGDRQLTNGRRDAAPSWSPTGDRLAFVRDGSIFVARADGTGAACLPTGKAVVSRPAWQPAPR
jgi:dipeptidyl aminopeptidase/acylaminoacyl peptidase/polyisoprenoid-binding protein YceI